MWFSENWKDYELLDTSDGERLERWGNLILIRPDPQIIWKDARKHPAWKKADGIYRRSHSGGGAWVKNSLPESWKIQYGDLGFVLRPMGFKHTGLFPEQAANWDWFSGLIREANRPAVAFEPVRTERQTDADAVAMEISANLEAQIGTTEEHAPRPEPRHPVADTTSKFTNLQFGRNYDPTARK